MDASTELVTLAAGALTVTLAPGVGGAIASFQRDWRVDGAERHIDWLRPASAAALAGRHPLQMASFPLLPFCNRIRDGRATFEGRAIRLAPNHPADDSPHTLHGIGWQRPWDVLAAEGTRAELGLRVAADPGWPWSFTAQQSFALSARGLDVSVRLTNTSDAAMPAGIGHHPYFPHTPGTRLTSPVRQMWLGDTELMPTGLAANAITRQLGEGVELAQLDLDNNFSGWQRRAVIEWPAEGSLPARRLTLQAEPPLDYFVLYCPRGADHFCAEPVSQCTDWLNLRARYGDDAVGGTRLAPGDTLTARFSLYPEWSE